MRVLVALLAFAPTAALACAMPSDGGRRLEVALADIDAALVPPAPPVAEEPAKPGPTVLVAPPAPSPTAIPEVTETPVVQPRS